ncbi:MAG: D-sedoheptulose-7-phosphate isomerase [Fimbriimonas sp.]
MPLIESAAEHLVACLQGGGKILTCGNGGSAMDAQHFACELVGRFLMDRPGLASIALTPDSSILTAVANDYGFERVFARQVQAHGRPGDVLVGFSTSGRSPNVLAALREAKTQGMTTIGMTGVGDPGFAALCDFCFEVPSAATPRIQEVHLWITHTLMLLVERRIFGTPQGE